MKIAADRDVGHDINDLSEDGKIVFWNPQVPGLHPRFTLLASGCMYALVSKSGRARSGYPGKPCLGQRPCSNNHSYDYARAKETQDCSCDVSIGRQRHCPQRPSHLEIFLVPKTLLRRSTNTLGTVERDIRITRAFPTRSAARRLDEVRL